MSATADPAQSSSELPRVFVRDIEPDPGYEFRVFDPGEEVTVDQDNWLELVPVEQLARTEAALAAAGRSMDKLKSELAQRCPAEGCEFNRGHEPEHPHGKRLGEFMSALSGRAITLKAGGRVFANDAYWPYVGRPVLKDRVVEDAHPRFDGPGRGPGWAWTDPRTGNDRWVAEEHVDAS